VVYIRLRLTPWITVPPNGHPTKISCGFLRNAFHSSDKMAAYRNLLSDLRSSYVNNKLAIIGPSIILIINIASPNYGAAGGGGLKCDGTR
jgi:hypothetical protein